MCVMYFMYIYIYIERERDCTHIVVYPTCVLHPICHTLYSMCAYSMCA